MRTPQGISYLDQPPEYELTEILRSGNYKKPVENRCVVWTGVGVAVVHDLPARACAIRLAIA